MKRLEARAIAVGEPIVMTIRFVSPDKVVTDTLVVEIGQPARDLGKRGGHIATDNVS